MPEHRGSRICPSRSVMVSGYSVAVALPERAFKLQAEFQGLLIRPPA